MNTTKKEESNKHCSHCDRDGHTKNKCWKLHPKKNPHKKKTSKKSDMVSNCESLDDIPKVDEEITYAIVVQKVDKEAECSKKKEVEEKKMQLFHLKIQANKTQIESIFNPNSKINLIAEHLVNMLGLKIYNHPCSYPLGWVHKDAKLQVTKQSKLTFAINKSFIDKVVIELMPLDIYGVVFENPYLWDSDVIYYRRLNQYMLIKEGKVYSVNDHKIQK